MVDFSLYSLKCRQVVSQYHKHDMVSALDELHNFLIKNSPLVSVSEKC